MTKQTKKIKTTKRPKLTPNTKLHLTRDGLRAYFKALPPTKNVGIREEACYCPVATFIKKNYSIPKRYDLEVLPGSVVLTDNTGSMWDDKTGTIFNSGWLEKFVLAIDTAEYLPEDDEWTPEVTAAEAYRAINRA